MNTFLPLAKSLQVTPTIMHMEITPDIIQKALKKLQPDMARGPDGVAPVPGYLSWQETLSSHLYCQSLPQACYPRTFP